jgi:hypothetical protein
VFATLQKFSISRIHTDENLTSERDNSCICNVTLAGNIYST